MQMVGHVLWSNQVPLRVLTSSSSGLISYYFLFWGAFRDDEDLST